MDALSPRRRERCPPCSWFAAARGGSHEGGAKVGPLITRAVPWSEQTGDMTVRLSIGDFSRMTYLSVKALRRNISVIYGAGGNIDQNRGL